MAASSSTFFNMKNGSETFSTHTFAQNNSGFTHPSKGQFTHFQTGGTRSTFGISSADFAELMSKFTNDFIKNNQDILTLEHRESGIDSLKKKLQEADSAITDLAIKLKKKTIYTNTSNVANVVLDTGHIPIMLSNIAPASAYGRAARSVSSYDVETYFDNSPGAEGQAREYCVKTDMMKTIATLREDIVQVRYKTDSKSNLFFVID